MIVDNFSKVPKGVMCRPKSTKKHIEYYWMTKKKIGHGGLRFITWYRKWRFDHLGNVK